MKSKRVAVVGAGPGGLCAAMLLAARGFDVTVLEQNEHVGGRSGALHVGPYTFDTGSTMLMMPFVLEEMFDLAGTRMESQLQLVPLEPMYRLDFGERSLDMFADPVRMAAELRRFSPGSEAGFQRFFEREQRRLQHLYPVLQRSWPNLGSLLTPAVVDALPYVGLTRSLYATASSYFEDEALRLAFSFQSAYLGMSPWKCPGGFEMVPFVEHAWGITHARGGLNQLCEAMARVATSHGARVRTGAEVRRLIIEEGRCCGVELAPGERISSDAVVINADAAAALERLVDTDVSVRFRHERLERLDESCSTYMLYLGLDLPLPLQHHTFFFARDYRAEMERVFERGTLGDDLSLYVCNPSRTDPTLAPPGHSALYLLALVPNTRAPIDWEVEGPRMRERVLRTFEQRSGLRISEHVQAETSLTPVGWQEQYGVSHGAVFGPSHRITQLLAFRLPNQLPHPENVFLAGGATNPGSGLPTILESARIVARLICERGGVPFPTARPLPVPLFSPEGAATSPMA